MRLKLGNQPQATYSSSVYRVTAGEGDGHKLPVELPLRKVRKLQSTARSIVVSLPSTSPTLPTSRITLICRHSCLPIELILDNLFRSWDALLRYYPPTTNVTWDRNCTTLLPRLWLVPFLWLEPLCQTTNKYLDQIVFQTLTNTHIAF